AAADQRCRPRAGRVADAVGAVVLVLPDHPAGLLVQAQDALAAGDLVTGEGVGRVARSLRQHAVDDVDLTARDRRAGVAAADRRFPKNLRPARGELLDDAGLAPDAVALRPEPLRP